jgi:hypothetical protein
MHPLKKPFIAGEPALSAYSAPSPASRTTLAPSILIWRFLIHIKISEKRNSRYRQ